MTVKGQEERYPPPRLSDCCRFRSGDLRRDAPQRARCAETGHSRLSSFATPWDIPQRSSIDQPTQRHLSCRCHYAQAHLPSPESISHEARPCQIAAALLGRANDGKSMSKSTPINECDQHGRGRRRCFDRRARHRQLTQREGPDRRASCWSSERLRRPCDRASVRCHRRHRARETAPARHSPRTKL